MHQDLVSWKGNKILKKKNRAERIEWMFTQASRPGLQRIDGRVNARNYTSWDGLVEFLSYIRRIID